VGLSTSLTHSLLSPGVAKRLVAEFAERAKEPISTPALDSLTDREREVMTARLGACGREPRSRLRRSARVPRCVPTGSSGGQRGIASGLARRGDPESVGGTPGVTAVVSGEQAVVALIVYAVALPLIAGLALHRQDVK
jgi:hypothetical protein